MRKKCKKNVTHKTIPWSQKKHEKNTQMLNDLISRNLNKIKAKKTVHKYIESLEGTEWYVRYLIGNIDNSEEVRTGSSTIFHTLKKRSNRTTESEAEPKTNITHIGNKNPKLGNERILIANGKPNGIIFKSL